MAHSCAFPSTDASATIKIIRAGLQAHDTFSGEIMAMFLMATVGFFGIAVAMLNSGRDLEFNNRQMAGVYRSRWA